MLINGIHIKMIATKKTTGTNFGIKDYWRMLIKRGPKLPFYYFLNAHLFDIIYKTDTHAWLPKEEHILTPENFEHGVLYMSSWTSEIKYTFNKVITLIEHPNDYTFLDIGCGKGKVVLVWNQLLQLYGINQKVVGIDYYKPFINIAERNHNKIFSNIGNFLEADATKLSYDQFGKNLIVYLYNPFNETILKSVISALSNYNTFIIYNNPVHSKTIEHNGFHIIFEHHGFHQNCQTKIFKNT